MHAAQLQRDAQLEARIQSFEVAFNMQREAMDAFDLGKEPQSVRDRYELLANRQRNPSCSTSESRRSCVMAARIRCG
jgi:hypothetical protein